ncbi:MAG: NAD(P)-dependent oxidoreductase [Treponema sp.]|nr:NAD(P)-dependent oxidoreductase [Treponema sp.]
MKKIIISGATGMLGAALVKCAVERGLEILCVCRRESARVENLPASDRVSVQYADLSEYSTLRVSGTYDAFFHLAWDKTRGASRDDVDVQAENVRYTLDAARFAYRAGCAMFVGAGSQAEYGIVSEPLKPDTPINPRSGYGIAKYAAGKLAALLCKQIGLRFNWLRIVSAFGPFDAPHTLIMYAINELKAGRRPALTKCGQTWDYLYCDDAARAFLAVAESGVDGKAYPLGSGRSRELSGYLEALKNIVNPDGVLRFGEKDYYPHQPMHLCADISELIADTGWKPEVSFEEGIRKILETGA